MGLLKQSRVAALLASLALGSFGVLLLVRAPKELDNEPAKLTQPAASQLAQIPSVDPIEPIDPNTLLVYFEPNFLQGKRISRRHLGNTDLRNLLFGSLLAKDEQNRPTRPYLAESFEELNDGKLWKFKLQSSVSSAEVKRIYWEYAKSGHLLMAGNQFRDLIEIRTPSTREVHFIFSQAPLSASVFATDTLIARSEGKGASPLIDYDFLPGYFVLERIDESGWHLKRNNELKFDRDGDFSSVLLKRADKVDFLKNRASHIIAVVNTDDQDLPELTEMQPAAWLQTKSTLMVLNHKSKALAALETRDGIWNNAVHLMAKERLNSAMNIAVPNFHVSDTISFHLEVPSAISKVHLSSPLRIEAYGMWRGKEKAHLEEFVSKLVDQKAQIYFIDDGTMFPGFKISKSDIALIQIPRTARYLDSSTYLRFCSSDAALPDSSGQICDLVKSTLNRRQKAARFQQLLLDQKEVLPLFHFQPRMYKSDRIEFHPKAHGIDQVRFARRSKRP
jgi:hypothetical protein